MTRKITGPADLKYHVVMVNDENDRDRMRYEHVFTAGEVAQIIGLALIAGHDLGKHEGRGVFGSTKNLGAALENFNAWRTIAASLKRPE